MDKDKEKMPLEGQNKPQDKPVQQPTDNPLMRRQSGPRPTMPGCGYKGGIAEQDCSGRWSAYGWRIQ